MPKKLNGGPFGIFQHPFSKKIERGPFGGKKSHSAEKTKGDPLVSIGTVCYAKKENPFLVQLPGPKGTIWSLLLNFVELLVELFW